MLPTMQGVTILDAVGIRDDDVTDVVFDGAPDWTGRHLPSRRRRSERRCPGDWCSDVFLNFFTDGAPNPPYVDPTLGTVNPSTTCTPRALRRPLPRRRRARHELLHGDGQQHRRHRLDQRLGSILAASNDVTLTGSTFPPASSASSSRARSPDSCRTPAATATSAAGSLGRFVGPGQILAIDGNGEINLTIDLTSIPSGGGTIAVAAGDTRYFQAWHRDGVGGGSNFTNGLEITFQ